MPRKRLTEPEGSASDPEYRRTRALRAASARHTPAVLIRSLERRVPEMTGTDLEHLCRVVDLVRSRLV